MMRLSRVGVGRRSMDREKVRINVHDAVMAVVGGSKGKPDSIDGKTLKKVLEAQRKGNCEICPSSRGHDVEKTYEKLQN